MFGLRSPLRTSSCHSSATHRADFGSRLHIGQHGGKLAAREPAAPPGVFVLAKWTTSPSHPIQHPQVLVNIINKVLVPLI